MLEQTTVSAVAVLMTMGKGAAIGAAIETVFGPVGIAIGGFFEEQLDIWQDPK